MYIAKSGVTFRDSFTCRYAIKHAETKEQERERDRHASRAAKRHRAFFLHPVAAFIHSSRGGTLLANREQTPNIRTPKSIERREGIFCVVERSLWLLFKKKGSLAQTLPITRLEFHPRISC